MGHIDKLRRITSTKGALKLGEALFQYEVDKRGDNPQRRDYGNVIMFSRDALKKKYGHEIMAFSGDALYVTEFLINLFAGPKELSIDELAHMACDGWYRNGFRDSINSTNIKWFSELEKNVGISSEKVNIEEFSQSVATSKEFEAYVVLAADKDYYNEEKLDDYHYVVFLGVNLITGLATVYNPFVGVEEVPYDALFDSAMMIWKITDSKFDEEM